MNNNTAFQNHAGFMHVFDRYGDTNGKKYFGLCFGKIPSTVELYVAMKDKKKNMEKVLDFMDLESYALSCTVKEWRTKDAKNSKLSEDFPYAQIWKSPISPLLILIELSGKWLHIYFYYDQEDQALEEWVLGENHRLRSRFGKRKSSSFSILYSDRGGFRTKEVSTKNFGKLNISDHYNDNFLEIHDIISNSIKQKESGLILLHGLPGTGKTSYIKHLISQKKKKEFIFIQNDFVQQLIKPEFITFLLRHKGAILIIEDAEKIVMPREQSSQHSVVSTILQLTDGLFSDFLNIKIICTFNTKISKVDQALLRKGRLIANYEFKELSAEKSKALCEKHGQEVKEKPMTLAEIFNADKKGFEQLEKKKIGF